MCVKYAVTPLNGNAATVPDVAWPAIVCKLSQ